ncbi:MAG: methionyl-tRNA formyltransferase [Opitutaceae bacterium]|nr:methionyl-tRNA formyltransferase [Opitutaceae bacterium]
MSTRLRVVFFGSDAIALPLLEWLAGEGSARAEVAAVFTQPDREAGRGQKIQPGAIKTWAQRHGLAVFQPEKITEEVRLQLTAVRPDLGLVMAYGHILRDDFIAVPRLGMLNLHTSLLPRYRGASPIQSAVASGERETGVTLMRIVRRLDAGPIIDAERVAIGALDTATEVEARLARACVPLLQRLVGRLEVGALVETPQREADATYCRKLSKDDGALDLVAPAATLAARVNGLFPWPSCVLTIGGQPIKLGLADVAPASAGDGSAAPGTVLGADESGLLVATGAGVVRLRRLQRPGGKMLPAPEFLRGFPISSGTLLASRPMPGLVEGRPGG